MIEIRGHCSEKFASVKTAFEANFKERDEIGASVAITHEGEFVVDLWAGHLTRDKQQEWDKNTITNVWSSTKTMAAMSLLLLADRGEVDLHAPAATYWPEFAAAGKERVEVRHFLSHMAGLSGVDTPVEGEALYDWDWMVQTLAAQAPWWEPGTASGYHALTQGHLIGEIVRRVTGQSLGNFFAQEIAGPLGPTSISVRATCTSRAFRPWSRPLKAFALRRMDRSLRALFPILRLMPARRCTQAGAAQRSLLRTVTAMRVQLCKFKASWRMAARRSEPGFSQKRARGAYSNNSARASILFLASRSRSGWVMASTIQQPRSVPIRISRIGAGMAGPSSWWIRMRGSACPM